MFLWCAWVRLHVAFKKSTANVIFFCVVLLFISSHLFVYDAPQLSFHWHNINNCLWLHCFSMLIWDYRRDRVRNFLSSQKRPTTFLTHSYASPIDLWIAFGRGISTEIWFALGYKCVDQNWCLTRIVPLLFNSCCSGTFITKPIELVRFVCSFSKYIVQNLKMSAAWTWSMISAIITFCRKKKKKNRKKILFCSFKTLNGT